MNMIKSQMRKRPLDDDASEMETSSPWGEPSSVQPSSQSGNQTATQPAIRWGPPALDAAAVMTDERAEAFASMANGTLPQPLSVAQPDKGAGERMLPRSLQVRVKPPSRAPPEHELFW